jgi:hypothetical protein
MTSVTTLPSANRLNSQHEFSPVRRVICVSPKRAGGGSWWDVCSWRELEHILNTWHGKRLYIVSLASGCYPPASRSSRLPFLSEIRWRWLWIVRDFVCFLSRWVSERLGARVRSDLKMLLSTVVADVINTVLPILAVVQIVDVLLLDCFLNPDVGTGTLRRRLEQNRATMRGFWMLPACCLKCVLCLLSIDAVLIKTFSSILNDNKSNSFLNKLEFLS